MKLRGLIEDAFEKAGVELPKQPEKKAAKVSHHKAGTPKNPPFTTLLRVDTKVCKKPFEVFEVSRASPYQRIDTQIEP